MLLLGGNRSILMQRGWVMILLGEYCGISIQRGKLMLLSGEIMVYQCRGVM